MTPPSSAIRRIDLQTNYWDLYAQQEDILLEAIHPLPDGIGVQLKLKAAIPDFSHFVYSTDEGSRQKSQDGKIHIRFEDTQKPEVQHSVTTIAAVTQARTGSKPYTIVINYYPGALYASDGQTSPGRIIVHQTDLVMTGRTVTDWVLHQPSLNEKNFARQTWGHLMDPSRPDYENALALAANLIDELDPYLGTPSDEMYNLHPFQQYLRIKAGKDRLWCANISAIFTHACNALDIPSRTIAMERLPSPNAQAENDYVVMVAQGHRTTEIFSKQLDQWIWMDLTFYILGAYLGPEGPLNLAELHLYLNNKNRLKNLQIVEYDPQTRLQQKKPVLQSDKRADLFNYFKRDQQFHYISREQKPTP